MLDRVPFALRRAWRSALGASKPTTEGSDTDLFGVPTHVILDLAWRDKSLLWHAYQSGPKPIIPPSTEEARVCELRLGWSASLEEVALNTRHNHANTLGHTALRMDLGTARDPCHRMHLSILPPSSFLQLLAVAPV
jgi:hypothetical protein